MRIWYIMLICFSMLLTSCVEKKDKVDEDLDLAHLKSGTWRGVLNLGDNDLPFTFILLQKNGKCELAVINAQEKITVNEISRIADSLFIKMPIFDSEFQLKIVDSANLEGVWINNYFSSDYKVPFTATFHQKFRFREAMSGGDTNISGKYEVTFAPGSDNELKAVGLFKQGKKNPNYLTGT